MRGRGYIVGKPGNLQISPPIQHPAFCDCQKCSSLPEEERGVMHTYRIRRASPYPYDVRKTQDYAMEVMLEERRKLTVRGLPFAEIQSAAIEKKRRRPASVVYVVRCSVTGAVKIGCTAKLERRLRSLQNSSATRLELLATMRGGETVEGRLHRRYAEYRLHGEWFQLPTEILDALRKEMGAKAEEARWLR